jgi:hypothetical protein
VDAFGTNEVTFVTLLKGNWFLGILLYHKPFLFDRCPVSGSLVGILTGYQWMVLRHFNSALRARKQVCSYLSLVHEVIKIFDLASWCFGTVLRNLTTYQMRRLRWGASQVPAKRAEQAFSLPNLGAQVSHWTFPAPKIFRLISRLWTPWVDT